MARGGTREQVSRPWGLAPRASPPRPADPSRPLRERRGRTASRGGEPEVQGGAPGNPSPSEPGRCGLGWEEEGGALREVSREEPGGEEAPPPPLRAGSLSPPKPLTLLLASGRRRGGCHIHGRRERQGPGAIPHQFPFSAPAPLRGESDPTLKRTPQPQRGHPPARGAVALSLGLRQWGAELAP